MESFRQDLRFALRQMVRNPRFSAVVVVTLALGIGANTAIFSVVDSVLLKPLPYEHGERVVRFGDLGGGEGHRAYFSIPEKGDYTAQTATFAEIMEYHPMAFTLLGHGDPMRVRTGVVSANFFDGFGVHPILGRGFRSADEEPGADAVLLLVYDFWRNRLQGDTDIVGRNLMMNDRPITVIGVLPDLPDYPEAADVYMPTAGCPFRSSERTTNSRNIQMVQLFGRLKPGTSRERAESDVATVGGRLRAEHPSVYGDSAEASHLELIPIEEDLNGDFRGTLLLLLGVVGLVLLTTCANIANLMLSRLVQRERELVVRKALGVGRRRLIRQLLTETTLLAVAGGVLGLGVAAGGSRLLVLFASRFTALSDSIAIDGRVLAFTLALSVGTGLVFGLAPALQASGKDLATGLKEGAGRTTSGGVRHRVGKALVVVQVAVSFVLLVAAGLMIRSVIELQRVDPGFKPEKVVTFTLSLPFSKYGSTHDFMAFFDRFTERAQALPGVEQVALGSDIPLGGLIREPGFQIDGVATDEVANLPRAGLYRVSEGYFETLQVPLLGGRTFTPDDTEDSVPVVIVNQSLARQHFPGGTALGGRLVLPDYSDTRWTIVGVVGDVHQLDLRTQVRPAIYFPDRQIPGSSMEVVARTTASPEAVMRDIQAVVRELDPDQPVANLGTLAELHAKVMAPPRLTAALLTSFGLLAFAISAVGLVGVVSFNVAQRSRELGVRSALGARSGQLFSMVMRQGLGLGLVGLVLGLGGALAASRLMAGLLFQVEALDPVTFTGIAVFLLAVVLAATALPARRATQIDPVVALRSE